MPPSMWGNLTIFLTRKRTKRKIQFAISGSAADGIVKKEKKKIKKPEKHKSGRMDLLLNCEQWVVLN